MKILFIGVFNSRSTNNSQARGFERANCRVVKYDYREMARALGSEARRDEHLSQLCAVEKPDLVLFSKCNEVNIGVVRHCNAICKTVLWYMDPLNDNFCQSLILKIQECAFSCFALYAPWKEAFKYGANNHLIQEGYDPDIDMPIVAPLRHNVSFIGNLRGERRIYHKDLGFHVYSESYGRDHAVAVGESAINLNFTEGGTSDRTYKILAARGFLLTQPWPNMEADFTPNQDFVVFRSINDLKDLIGYYIKRPYERTIIAWNGFRTVRKYSRDAFAQRLITLYRNAAIQTRDGVVSNSDIDKLVEDVNPISPIPGVKQNRSPGVSRLLCDTDHGHATNNEKLLTGTRGESSHRQFGHYDTLDISAGVSILIPTWNNLEYIHKCVDSIIKFSSYNHEIILHVNDGSDGTLEFAKIRGIKHTISPHNIGICRAINQCAGLATRNCVAYFNDDMVALPGWDVELHRFALKYSIPSNAWLSATMIEGFGNNDCCIADGDKYNYGRTIDSFDEKRLLSDLESLKALRSNVNGSTWPPNIMHRRMWDAIGGFSEEFSPGIGSDPDLAKKMWDVGCRHFIGIGRSLVYHFGSKTLNKVARNDGRKTFHEKYGITIDEFVWKVLRRGSKWTSPARGTGTDASHDRDARQMKEAIYIDGRCPGLGDQLCLLSAARLYAKQHRNVTVSTPMLPDIVQAYGDDLIRGGIAGKHVYVDAESRHRRKNESPDLNYVGTYAVKLEMDFNAHPSLELPTLDPCSSLLPGGYIALQPYSGFIRDKALRRHFTQRLIDVCNEQCPGWPIVIVGNPDTPRDLDKVDYSHLGRPIDLLRYIQHAGVILTPRSASAHAASAYGVPTFLWLPDDGENWHLDYPDWPHFRAAISDGIEVVASQLNDFLHGVCSGLIIRPVAYRIAFDRMSLPGNKRLFLGQGTKCPAGLLDISVYESPAATVRKTVESITGADPGLYPAYLNRGNAVEYIEEEALHVCRGYGVDVGASRWPLKGAIAVDNDSKCNAYNLQYIADNSLDYVFSSHCLEHLERPDEAIELWERKLRNGGVLFLYLPHPDMVMWRGPGATWAPDHKWIPTPCHVKQLVESAGLEVRVLTELPDPYWSFRCVAIKLSREN